MRLLRSLGAVISGYLVFALSAVALFQLSGRDPHAVQPTWFEVAAVLYGMAFAAAGGALAARLAPGRPLRHAAGVSLLLASGAAVSLLASPGSGASWSQWTALLLMAPCALIGGRWLDPRFRGSALALLLLLAPTSGHAQSAWANPAAVPWNLADVAVHGSPDGHLLLLAVPSPSTTASDTGENLLVLQLDTAVTREWTGRARRLLDSVVALPRDLHDRPVGFTLSTDGGGGSITLGYDQNGRPVSRFLLVVAPPRPSPRWSVRGDRESAYGFIEMLERAVAAMPPVPPGDESPGCDYQPPRLLKEPDFDWPALRYTSGQVLLSLQVDSLGVPQDSSVFILVSSDPDFSRAVRNRLNKVKYAPATCDGRPIAARTLAHFGWFLTPRGKRMP